MHLQRADFLHPSPCPPRQQLCPWHKCRRGGSLPNASQCHRKPTNTFLHILSHQSNPQQHKTTKCNSSPHDRKQGLHFSSKQGAPEWLDARIQASTSSSLSRLTFANGPYNSFLKSFNASCSIISMLNRRPARISILSSSVARKFGSMSGASKIFPVANFTLPRLVGRMVPQWAW